MHWSRNQQLYLDDFKEVWPARMRTARTAKKLPPRSLAGPAAPSPCPLPMLQLTANKTMHPYVTMVGDSSPHNLITGPCFPASHTVLRCSCRRVT